MKDDIDGRYYTPEEDITGVGFFENSFAEISPDNDSIFSRDLLPGEHIITTASGKSAKGSLFEKIFSLFWMMFVIMWILAALKSGDGFVAVFGLPHAIVGILLLLQAGFIRTKVNIAVTDKRLLIRNMGKTQAVYLEKALKAMIFPSDNDSNWNISFEGINNNIFKSNGNKSKALSYEIPREDALKIADIIDRIIKGEYI